MTKRTAISKATRDAVLNEYRHKCAVCGEDRPHLHHIDENPANNDLLNLLPLCPNCHLSDQHNPTARHDPEKLALFRRYKDPAILLPQFQAIFDRLHFFFRFPTGYYQERFSRDLDDLLAFIRGMEMGNYYAERLKPMMKVEPYEFTGDSGWILAVTLDESLSSEAKAEKMKTVEEEERQRFERERNRWCLAQRDTLDVAKDEILRLVVESLRFQRWAN
jgi:hypothetical protein